MTLKAFNDIKEITPQGVIFFDSYLYRKSGPYGRIFLALSNKYSNFRADKKCPLTREQL